MATRLLLLSLMLLLEPAHGFSAPGLDPGVASIFPTKRDNSCPNSNYTAPNGLQFKTFCLENAPFNDILNTTAKSMEDCMNQCASLGGACWGIAYNFDDGTCYFKNQSIISTTPGSQGQTHTAFATNINTNPDTSCPWTNSTDHSTPNGMDFGILCGKDMPFDDFCPDNGPTSQPPRSTDVCPYHTDSLEECLELCSQTHPICKAVVYNPDMEEGYGNCYPKSDFSTSNLQSKTSNPTTHLAVAANWPTLNSSCTNGSIYTAPNNEQFTVSCNDNRPFNDLIQVHSTNLSYCIDSCASYSNSTTGPCVGIVYDSTLTSGWQNCWLKSANGVSTADKGNHFALKVGNVPTNTSGSSSGSSSNSAPSSSSSSSSKAWIAGPVVGGIAGIALIGAGILYFLRRNKSKQSPAPIPPGYEQQVPMDEQQPAYADNAKYAGYTNSPPIHEMDGVVTQELPTEREAYELPGNFERQN